jgi:hypothetical protein
MAQGLVSIGQPASHANNVLASRLTATVWPGLTSPLDDDPVNGRPEQGAIEINSGLIESCLSLLDNSVRILKIGFSHVLFCFRNRNGLLLHLDLLKGCAQVGGARVPLSPHLTKFPLSPASGTGQFDLSLEPLPMTRQENHQRPKSRPRHACDTKAPFCRRKPNSANTAPHPDQHSAPSAMPPASPQSPHYALPIAPS